MKPKGPGPVQQPSAAPGYQGVSASTRTKARLLSRILGAAVEADYLRRGNFRRRWCLQETRALLVSRSWRWR
jgi:hypothetical protein